MRAPSTVVIMSAVILTACDGGRESDPGVADESTTADATVEQPVVPDEDDESLDDLLRLKQQLVVASERYADLHSASFGSPSEGACRYEEDRVMSAIEQLDVGLPSAEFRTALNEMRVAVGLLTVTCATGAGSRDTDRWFDAAGSAELALEQLIIDAGG